MISERSKLESTSAKPIAIEPRLERIPRAVGTNFSGLLEILGTSRDATDRSDASREGEGAVAELDRYFRYAEEAKRCADAAESKNVKAAWLRIAKGWLSLLPQRYSRSSS